MRYEELKYGFGWGNADVERSISYNGYRVPTVKTPRGVASITVTPSGLVKFDFAKYRRDKLVHR